MRFRKRAESPAYPRLDGDVIALGPTCFINLTGDRISYRGRNFVVQPEPTPVEQPVLCLHSAWPIRPDGECAKFACRCHIEAPTWRTQVCSLACTEAHTYSGGCLLAPSGQPIPDPLPGPPDPTTLRAAAAWAMAKVNPEHPDCAACAMAAVIADALELRAKDAEGAQA